MRIFGNLCVGLIGLGACGMLPFLSGSVTQYDYIVAGLVALFLLVWFLGLFIALTARGKLDFLGWPRLGQYGAAVIVSLSLTVVMGMAAALHGTGGSEFPWSIRPFCPWAAVVIPVGLAVLGALWLNSDKFAVSEAPLRNACRIMVGIALLSNCVFAVEIGLARRQAAEERERTALAVIQQTDPETEFFRLLGYSSRYERPAVRQLALQKILATGPRFNALMIDCLQKPVFEDGLTYLRDNDPPGDTALLAEPARGALLLLAARLREEIGTGRPLDSHETELRVDSVLTVAGKFAQSGVDFVPAVRACRVAFESPRPAGVPGSCVKKLDAWLSANAK